MEDIYKQKLRINKLIISELQSVCYEKCAEKQDVPMITYNEGLCIRNCYTKFGVWYPTLRTNLMDSSLVDYYSMLQESKQSK